jgi:hypothetical protein
MATAGCPAQAHAERSEDFLARYRRHLPTGGRVGIFNRTPFEGVFNAVSATQAVFQRPAIDPARIRRDVVTPSGEA